MKFYMKIYLRVLNIYIKKFMQIPCNLSFSHKTKIVKKKKKINYVSIFMSYDKLSFHIMKCVKSMNEQF